jgi:hypothetical protein
LLLDIPLIAKNEINWKQHISLIANIVFLGKYSLTKIMRNVLCMKNTMQMKKVYGTWEKTLL